MMGGYGVALSFVDFDGVDENCIVYESRAAQPHDDVRPQGILHTIITS